VGEHTVIAQAGQLKWEINVTVDKAGQRLIKTGFRPVQRLQPWQGDWYASLYYSDQSSYYFESFEFQVKGQDCQIRHDSGFVVANTRPASYPTTGTWTTVCTAADDGSLTDGFVTATVGEGQRTLQFNAIWGGQRYSLPLTDTASGKRAEGDAQNAQARAETDAQEAKLRPWIGEWYGEASGDRPVSGSTSYRTEQEGLTIHVYPDGRCSAAAVWTSTFHYHGEPDDKPVVTTHNGIECSVVDAEKLNLGIWGGAGGTDVFYSYGGHATVSDHWMGTTMNINLKKR
jgi:hypothetical protein